MSAKIEQLAKRLRSDAENIGHSKRSLYPCGSLLDAAAAIERLTKENAEYRHIIELARLEHHGDDATINSLAAELAKARKALPQPDLLSMSEGVITLAYSGLDDAHAAFNVLVDKLNAEAEGDESRMGLPSTCADDQVDVTPAVHGE